ncbi:MAG: cell division protein FtsA [Omnitrophica WOR_2 bacterium RIFCSPHIGHO2_01_FULL_48_9]|nr:MAG: cell division protein FtsA [Omnitrophica WOR_2 bacterium RIFCSPHIGHO2_02_FULL_48_11]OGX30705.1 MAG: cell division protein FtsA [Omnitrophica WOR_2 bacterium RIFCSPHIGHO2_01_FULL_48_9]
MAWKERVQLLGKLKSEKVFCGLDVGSQRIKISLLKAPEPQLVQLLDLYETKTTGFKDSSVSDLGELTESIQLALNAVMKKNGLRINEVYLGVGGDLIDVRQTQSTVPLIERGSKVIANVDIKKVNTQARLLGTKMDEEILHDFPQSYRVDDANTALNPLGLYGRKLAVETMLVVANGARLRNVIKAIHDAGYEVAGSYFTTYAAAEVILTEKDKHEGCILLDIGSRVSSVLIFKDGILKYIGKIPWGGNNITQRIATDLNLSLDLAEEIKKSYAVALKSDRRNEEEILVKREAAYSPVKREAICTALDPEIENFVLAIKDTIYGSGLFHQINVGVVLIGGGAVLPGLLERLEESINFPVAAGKMKATNNSPHSVAVYSPAVGLAQLGAHNSFATGLPTNGQLADRNPFINKVKEFYQEYF